MASLRDVVSEYQDDLRNGIAWLAFWREGRSWQAEAFHLDLDDTLYPEDRARLAEIQAADPRAIVVNGYYSGYLSEEMSVAELAAGVRHHYDNGLNTFSSAAFSFALIYAFCTFSMSIVYPSDGFALYHTSSLDQSSSSDAP